MGRVRRPRVRRAVAHLAPLLLLSCGDPESAPKPDSPPEDSAAVDTGYTPRTLPLSGPCETTNDLGGFTLLATADATTFTGGVATGPDLATLWEIVAIEGDCQLLRHPTSTCTGCEADEICLDGSCLPAPTFRDLGPVAIEGLGASLTVAAGADGAYAETLSHPGFTGGELLTLRVADTTLHGVGAESFTVLDSAWNLESGVDLEVHWSEQTYKVVRGQMVVSVTVDSLGADPTLMQCTFSDDSRGTLPGALVGTLLEAGVSGTPVATLRRRTADRVDESGGCYDFVVAQERGVVVNVP